MALRLGWGAKARLRKQVAYLRNQADHLHVERDEARACVILLAEVIAQLRHEDYDETYTKALLPWPLPGRAPAWFWGRSAV